MEMAELAPTMQIPTGAEPCWPAKTRELHNHHFDSTIWNDFAFRDDDIVIGTYAKSGTVPVHGFETPLCAYAAIGIGPI
jgi:aryl sulfotransferase